MQVPSFVIVLVVGFVTILCVVGFALAGFVLSVRSSGAWKLATSYARMHPYIRRKVGGVRGFGLFPAGQIQVQGTGGEAEFGIKVKGELGEARLFVRVTKAMGEWHLQQATCEAAGERIVLHGPPIPGPEPPRDAARPPGAAPS
ncbi:MAG: hypothetical protein HYV63_19345 [Candidatus Schekmanbacteria bacterium]|nr:hypothetical protein [Candidatus Schekmanbacteria bacterium]